MPSQISKARVQHWSKRLECPVDENANYENTYWCNRDLIPIPPDRRTWTWQGYAGYWIITGANNSAWMAGSTLISLGLSVSQSMGVIVGSSLIIAIIAIVAGWMGSHDYLGFTVMSRASWGMIGGFWPVLNRIMTACIWMGIQTYWGGQAIKIVLGAVIGPKYAFMSNTLPASANVDTCSLVSFFIFLVVFFPCLFVPPEKLQMPLRIAFIMIVCNIFGMLIWAVRTAGGAGSLMSTGPTESGSMLSWNTVYGIQAILGLWSGGIVGQSDWTRYAKTQNASIFGQGVTAPLTIIITALCGVIITSATYEIYGQYFWNPFELLLHVQSVSMTPAARAGTFFSGLAFLASQLALCIILNGISTGMDMAALCPRWINIRRGCVVLTIIAVAVCPWNYVNSASTFITVLSGWSIFLSGMTGILISDYFLVRKRQLHVGDMYLGNSSSAYWYTYGVNWRAVVAWAMSIWPLLPGFVRRVQGTANGNGWDHCYDLSYFFGFFMAVFVHWGLHAAFPAKKQTGQSPFVMELHRGEMIEGHQPSYESSSNHDGEAVIIGEKNV
ncbi:hypothetical protein BP6252_06850 [Coleophoma cylindrospora]|uniref:Uracil permease n=1 Tax=Coleophoma cylindrospora TaxID=1849047 RepID=A0A3D8RFV7_9HELO|nr:hypothetical protein BP6252_06850 [Coleophoma cylindrospora]